ncbi:hypothetical protein X971_2576 [Agrobacterium tumefaciens LBA4213 (Ach5)]|nr:hypothetical protein X971_2576 [Agrobacterium tumefaciens LBA4213 (Ach5)]
MSETEGIVAVHEDACVVQTGGHRPHLFLPFPKKAMAEEQFIKACSILSEGIRSIT